MTPYEQFKIDLARHYELFAAGLMGRYLAIVASAGTPAPPHLIEMFASQARGHVKMFIVGADNMVDHYAQQVGIGDGVARRSEELKQSLRVTALKNARDLVMRLRSGNEGLKALFNRRMGAVGLLLQQRMAKPELKSADDAGRMWDSSKLVTVLGRDFAYQAFIDAQAATLVSEGYFLAKVVYPNPMHANHDTIISLDGTEEPDFPVLAAVRADFFHPNSSAQLRHV